MSLEISCPSSGSTINNSLFECGRDLPLYSTEIAQTFYTGAGFIIPVQGSSVPPEVSSSTRPSLCGSGNSQCVMQIPSGASFEVYFKTYGNGNPGHDCTTFLQPLDNAYLPERCDLTQTLYDENFAFYRSENFTIPSLHTSTHSRLKLHSTVGERINYSNSFGSNTRMVSTSGCVETYYNYYDWHSIQDCQIWWEFELYRIPSIGSGTGCSDYSGQISFGTDHLTYILTLRHNKSFAGNQPGAIYASRGVVSCVSGAIPPILSTFIGDDSLNDYPPCLNNFSTFIMTNSTSASDPTYILDGWCESIPSCINTYLDNNPTLGTVVRNG